MESRRDRIHQDVSRADFVLVEATATLTAIQRIVECDTTDGAITVTMCPPDQMKGLTVSIVLGTDGGTDVTITATHDKYWDGDITLNDAADGALMYSDGMTWWQIATVAA
ncbi:hypothetical protein KAR91_34470 [Candidatus Pacearchaeota archaeon]|nr:hypothetical protein [Candidatus Pacearchaeota archaeon]